MSLNHHTFFSKFVPTNSKIPNTGIDTLIVSKSKPLHGKA